MARDAIAILETDHRAVERLFEEVQGGSAGKDDVVERIVRELSIHDAVERELLYPAVREKLAGQGDALAEHSLDDHEAVASLLAEIESAGDVAARDRLLQQLMADVREHVEEEEREIFPQLRAVMSPAALDDLGYAIEEAKGRAPTHPHPHTPRSAVGARVAGAAASLADRARDALT